MRARFGTAGNPDGFYQAGKKQSKDMPPWLREQGLIDEAPALDDLYVELTEN